MHRAKAYALAVVNTCTCSDTASTVDVAVSALVRVLTDKGELSLYPKILREISKEMERRSKTQETVLTVARSSDAPALTASLANHPATKHLNIKHVLTDDRLVGGYTIGDANAYADASFRTKLIQLFNSLV
jgi:F0F1-type ATP synthase delta subunit